jgi:hypothetical protein
MNDKPITGKHPDGLRERIAIAQTPEDVSKLLDEGSTYAMASEKTRNSWRNTAAGRLDFFAKRDGLTEALINLARRVLGIDVADEMEAKRAAQMKHARLAENYGSGPGVLKQIIGRAA